MKNEKAMNEFLTTIAAMQDRLAELQEYVGNHMNYDPETLNWGHVGSAQHMLAALTELTDQAYKRGEYVQD